MSRNDIFGGLILFFFGAVTAALSLSMSLGSFRAAGSGLFPFCLGLLLMGLSLLLIINTLRPRNRAVEKALEAEKKTESPWRIILFLGILVLVTFFLNSLGYSLASFLLMVGLLRVLGVKRWGVNLFISLVTAVGAYFLFVHWLRIPLPKGFLGI